MTETASVIRDRLSSYLDADVYGIGSSARSPPKNALFQGLDFWQKTGRQSGAGAIVGHCSHSPSGRRKPLSLRWPLIWPALKALQTIVGGIIGRRGRLVADKDLIVKLASTLVCNAYGSRRIGALVGPILREGGTS